MFNIISVINKSNNNYITNYITKHASCKCECNIDGRKSNSIDNDLGVNLKVRENICAKRLYLESCYMSL